MKKINFIYNNNKYIIYSEYTDDHIFKIINTHKTFYEIKLLEQIKNLNLTGVAIDIGSNIGNHSLFFSNECKFDLVESYELSNEIYEILLKNIVLNKMNNINAYNIGLSDTMKTVGISNIDKYNIGMTHIISGDNVLLSTLDSIYSNYNKKIGLIKIDTEGSEYDILVGSKNTINEHSPILVIEIQDEIIFNKINNFLVKYNYKTDKIKYTATPTYIWKRTP